MERSLHFDLKDGEGKIARRKLDLWVYVSTQFKGQMIPLKDQLCIEMWCFPYRMSSTSHGLFTTSTTLENEP